jgi:hypothetical protein
VQRRANRRQGQADRPLLGRPAPKSHNRRHFNCHRLQEQISDVHSKVGREKSQVEADRPTPGRPAWCWLRTRRGLAWWLL